MAEIKKSYIVMYKNPNASINDKPEPRLVHELNDGNYALQCGPIGWKILTWQEFCEIEDAPLVATSQK